MGEPTWRALGKAHPGHTVFMTTVAPPPAESLLLFETEFDHVACNPGYQELRSAGTEVAQVVLSFRPVFQVAGF